MIGERVKLAREACGFTQLTLADISKLSQGMISDLEAGHVPEPSQDTIIAISRATAFPITFFYLGPLPDLPEGNYRRRARGASRDDKQIRAQVKQIIEIIQRSEHVLKLPPVRIEPISQPRSLDEIEDIALYVREVLGVGATDPVSNIIRAVERAGVIVARIPNIFKDFDSYSAWPDLGINGRPIIVLTSGHSGDRDRFNIGHELGHLLFHAARPNIENKQAEAEANRLSGTLLLPKRAAKIAIRPPVTLQVLKNVKESYGISIAASAQRALDLDIISRTQFVSIHKQLSARQWKKKEPVEVPLEKSILLPKILEALSPGRSISGRAACLHMPALQYKALTSAM